MDKDFFPWSQTPTTFPIDMSFYNTSSNWDQHDPFESALSSMVSSPAAASSNPVDGGVQLVELIGKLGSICSPNEISPHYSSFIPINHSGNTSCYSTPLNSPPKLDLPSELTAFATDPGFAERAARFSCFGNRSFNERSQRSVNDVTEMSKLNRFSSCNLPRSQTQPDSNAESSVSQKIQSHEANIGGKKRKSAPRGKAKETQSSKVGAKSNDSGTKRTKSDEMEKSEKSGGEGNVKENSNLPDPHKDYIHVRARRGQATDSHSLAERVRREKISERMKFLQDLVPGCNKVTGKAVMLDEIINYVQSLQRQVEFLSMKLATVNPRMDDSVHMETLLSKEVLQSRGNMFPVTSSSSASVAFSYAYQSQEPQQRVPNASNESQFCNNLPINGFSNSVSQVSMWGDELHNVVQMGFGSSSMETSHIKMEP